MGGRKPTSIKVVLGTKGIFNQGRHELRQAISSASPKGIANATTTLLQSSKTGLANLSRAVQMLDLFDKAPPGLKGQSDAKAYAAAFWEKVRNEKQIDAHNEIDKLLVNIAARTLSRRGTK